MAPFLLLGGNRRGSVHDIFQMREGFKTCHGGDRQRGHMSEKDDETLLLAISLVHNNEYGELCRCSCAHHFPFYT